MSKAFDHIKYRVEAAAWTKAGMFQYCQKMGTNIVRTHCKLCGRTLTENDKVAVELRVVVIKFDNGSKHETSLCVTCAYVLKEKPKPYILEFVYAADLNSWLNGNNMQEDDPYWDVIAWRVPIEIVEIRTQ